MSPLFFIDLSSHCFIDPVLILCYTLLDFYFIFTNSFILLVYCYVCLFTWMLYTLIFQFFSFPEYAIQLFISLYILLQLFSSYKFRQCFNFKTSNSIFSNSFIFNYWVLKSMYFFIFYYEEIQCIEKSKRPGQ